MVEHDFDVKVRSAKSDTITAVHATACKVIDKPVSSRLGLSKKVVETLDCESVTFEDM